MTSPPFSGSLRISDATLDDLLSALRRHHAGDATRLLTAWAAEPEPQPDGLPWEAEDDFDVRQVDHPLSGWVHREAMQHVAGGRFEHALALIETYRSTKRRQIQPDQLVLPGVSR